MMNNPSVLGIDSVSGISGAALKNSSFSKCLRINSNKETSTDLLYKIEELLQNLDSDNALPLSKVSCVAVIVGPGSLTGIRVGISMVQGLLFDSDLPVVPVETFEAMEKYGEKKVDLAVLQMRRTEWLVKQGNEVIFADEEKIRSMLLGNLKAVYIGNLPDGLEDRSDRLIRITDTLALAASEIGFQKYLEGWTKNIYDLLPSYYIKPYTK